MNLMRTFFWVLCLAGTVLAERTTPPNVVFILTDDQSWDSIGFLGGKVHTPRLDRMAKEGMQLTDFNVTSTVCSPSRYSFLTGRYAGRCKAPRFMTEHPPGDQTQVENIGELELEGWNLAKLLQKHGYQTGFVGKSHVVNHHWFHGRWEGTGLESYPVDADPRDPVVNAKMRRNHRRWCEAIKPYGFDYVDGVYAANLKELQNATLNVHNLDWTVSKALQFLEAQKSQGAGTTQAPFFLYFSTTLHHGPAPWANRFSLESDPRFTGEGFVPEGFDVLPSRADVLRRNKDAGFADNKAFALWLDDGVGALIDKVRELGMERDTLVIFTSDHGSWRHGKATLYDFGLRVPVILQWPGRIKPGSQYNGLLANIDLAPTILDLCGIQPPKDYMMDGVSFAPQIFGDRSPVREVLFGELGHSRMVKTQDWKYIAVRYPKKLQERIDRGTTFKGFDGATLKRPYLTRNGHLGHYASRKNPHYFEPDQLFHLKTDVEEIRNVYERHPLVVQQMKAHLLNALKQFENRPFGEFVPAP